jgi:hypothetical protein
MTEQKHLKRRIRERIARTGESYTTGRRHVLAHAGARPSPGLVPGYPPTGGGVHHESTLLEHVLRQAGAIAPHTGAPYTEAMLCGLAGGIGFMYFVFDYAGNVPTMTIVAQSHPEPFVPAALARLAAPLDTAQTGSQSRAVRGLRDVVRSGRPAFCTVAQGKLQWHPLFGPAAEYSGADPYEVVVCGIDAETVLLDDESGRPRRLPVEDFAAAWSAHRKGRHRLIALTGPPPADLDLAAAVRDAVSATTGHLTGPVLGNAFDANFGLRGMRKLVEQLSDRRGRQGWLRRYSAPEAFFFALRRLHDCVEVEYGAPGATRPLYADFLAEASALVPSLGAVAPLYRRAGDAWSALATEALPADVPALAEYDDLVEQKLALLLQDGSPEELRAVVERMEALPVSYGADPLSEPDRVGLLDRLAALAAEAVAVEEAAVAALATV